MSTKQYMPSRGERAAPAFDKTKPRELSRFFKELEKLFTRVGVTAEADKKEHVLEYVDFDVEQIWKIFPEYADNTKTYKDFKDAILVHYPDAKGDHLYARRDLETLIKNRLRDGIQSCDDLQSYHLTYLAITTWLIEKNQMGDFEQKSNYNRAFQQPLLAAVKNRLRMLFMAHPANVPHKIQDVHDAARYVLEDDDLTPQQRYTLPVRIPVATVQSPVANEMNIKSETFAAVMSSFSKTIVDALQQGNRTRITGPTAPTTRHTDCNFCGGQHFIRECPIVDEYIVAGKCRRNYEGKVVLSTGAFVPKDIPGTLLRERMDEWHHRNPNQLSAATLIHTISTEHIRSAGAASHSTFQLSASDRIATLEAELFNLRARRPAFAPIVRTRAQRARESSPEASIEEVDETATDEIPPVPKPVPIIPVTQPSRPIITEEPTIVITARPSVEPEHPFRNAKDAAYAPPNARNVGAPIKPPQTKAAVPAYRTQPPIYDAAIATEVFKRAMDSTVILTQRELLALAPEVRTRMREDTTTKRIPATNAATVQGSFQIISNDEDIAFDSAPAFALQYADKRVPPKGATVVADPIEAYYKSLDAGESPCLDRLMVAKESTAIRSISALVDTSQKKECTVDPGCQVIAMSESTCHSLALVYDPLIRLNMESANGTFDWSLGLARNVPFQIGGITLYLQVHVIRSPSYEILLGRPFDVLTESVIRNFTNEDQTITITDPNTGKQCTIPTFARGTHNARSELDF